MEDNVKEGDYFNLRIQKNLGPYVNKIEVLIPLGEKDFVCLINTLMKRFAAHKLNN